MMPLLTHKLRIHAQVDLKVVLADKAYILFYTRRPVPWPLLAIVSSGPKAGTATGADRSSWTGEEPEYIHESVGALSHGDEGLRRTGRISCCGRYVKWKLWGKRVQGGIGTT